MAIGETKTKGINILPPDINISGLIFEPSYKENAIYYGMKGINKIGTALVYEIFKNRPYTSIEDFLEKVKLNKTQMISLLKAGAFDNLYPDKSREEILNGYFEMISDKKKRITLQNMKMLIEKDLIPKELDFERRLYNFNQYVKNFKVKTFYKLDKKALKFYLDNYDDSLLVQQSITENGIEGMITQKDWDNIYKKGMDPMRKWMKDNQQEILDKLNNSLLKDTIDKYGSDNISEGEMESLGFYYHDHELKNLHSDIYDIDDFNKLPEEPEVEKVFETKDGNEIKMFKLHRIAGTVIDKDKNKSTVILLTTTGVVTVKVWKNQFAKWDNQISEIGDDGKKHVIEKSWFKRGNKLVLTGIRRGDNFVPKKYKSTSYPLFTKINKLENGFITDSQTDRVEVEE